MLAHLLLGNGRTEDLLGQLLPSHPVLATKAHVVREAHASGPPPSERLEQGFVNLPLLQQHLYDMVAKARLEFLQINLGSDINPAVGRNQSIRDNRMQRGREVHQIANGLTRHHHPGNKRSVQRIT